MNQFTTFLSLILISLLLIQATTTPATHQELDDEMRGYVKEAVAKIGYNPDNFASHVTPTEVWASQNYFNNGWSSFYIITFDREFVEKQNVRVKKAIAAHEVGHAYYPCSLIGKQYQYGLATYLDVENCADVIASIIYSYEYTMEALKVMQELLPDFPSVAARVKLIEEQLGGIEKPEIDLTWDDE